MKAQGRQVRLALELDMAAEPVRGWVGEEGGSRHFFTGWLGLASLLEELGARDAPARDLREPEGGLDAWHASGSEDVS